jgi:hypothetical protein
VRVEQRTKLLGDAFPNPDGGGPRARIDVDAYGRLGIRTQRSTLTEGTTTKAANAADTTLTNDTPGP